MLPSTGKVLPIELLHSCCSQLDCWGRESSQPRGVWRNRLCFHLQVLHSYCFPYFLKICVQGTVPRDFRLLVFSCISFPQDPECTIRAISNFFEYLRRCSQRKVHHLCRWHRRQMEEIFNQKNVNYFVWTLLGSRVNIHINFCLQVHFKVSAAWYCSHYLPPVSTTPVVPVAKFVAGVVDTAGAPWLANIFSNFRKYSKWS
jgi:hypothetical protein